MILTIIISLVALFIGIFWNEGEEKNKKMMYSIFRKYATQTNAIGALQELHRQGKMGIVIFDHEAPELRYIIAIPKED